MPTTEDINNCEKVQEHFQGTQNLLPSGLQRNVRYANDILQKDEKNKAHEKLNLFQPSDGDDVAPNSSYFDINSYMEYKSSDLNKANLYVALNLQQAQESETKNYDKK